MSKIILLVEEYEDARLFTQHLLEGYGHEVISVADGYDAVESCKTHPPDLILMDIALPIMDGLAATKAIREAETGSSIPIIAITAHGNHFYERAIAAGCNDLIEKPIDFDVFEYVLKQYL